jgi:nucleoid-associated protein YgaU
MSQHGGHIQAGTNYTVQQGDTLSGIAQRVYNDSSEVAWKVIYNANKRVIGNDPNHIRPGEVLYIPPITTGSYTVQQGDTLSSIAQYIYGDSALWPRIYDANKQVIGNDPDHIRPGEVLQLPPID